ncbi:chemotaxis-specific protein-glutamate methyltransferase CheB [Stieleria varia]|uniref:Protein-glutamate methylesterase/protein-glutamine glutaminase n=1 Tax=Stieleria varia TaxID=2528005 RepID=A0A5C6B4S4_9BACT|nr:chemotaxis-specific protein-glutamate methyltransferase CheB [Stieleria varia]TWU06309.1 Chemotaxis response regulator protein-glutamate methylesterase [Stieleria varia]
MTRKLTAIVVDDSLIFRKVVRDCIVDFPGVEVVDVAKDGRSAIEKILTHRPDVVTLDVEMPGMNGLEVLERLQKEQIHTNVIMVSSQTQSGAATTTKALQIGAFDFILKPDHNDLHENVRELKGQLRTRIELLQRRNHDPVVLPALRSQILPMDRDHAPCGPEHQMDRVSVICIGISTGGPKTLSEMMPQLVESIRVPILIVQHMPALFTASMANSLDRHCKLPVCEAADGMPLRNGHVYLAPGGKQMRVSHALGIRRIEVNDDDAVNACKPSVDYLFKSCAGEFRDGVLAIMMTGMGDDGLIGCQSIAKHHGQIWAQDKTSSTVFGMPRAVIDAQLATQVLCVNEIAEGINQVSHSSHASSSLIAAARCVDTNEVGSHSIHHTATIRCRTN